MSMHYLLFPEGPKIECLSKKHVFLQIMQQMRMCVRSLICLLEQGIDVVLTTSSC